MLFDSLFKNSPINPPKSLQFCDDDIQLSVTKPIFQSSNNIFGIYNNFTEELALPIPTCTLQNNQLLSLTNEKIGKIEKDKFGKKKIKSINKEKKVKKEKVSKEEKEKIKKQRVKNGDFNNGRWTEDEHRRFIESILKYGNEWRKVEKYIGTRSSTQARSHAQKFFEKMKLANLIDECIDLDNKTSIKSLHETLKLMEKEKYLSAVQVLNLIPNEEKKKNSPKQVRNKDKANNEDIPENFGDLDARSTVESKKSTFIFGEDSNAIEPKEQAVEILDQFISDPIQISNDSNNKAQTDVQDSHHVQVLGAKGKKDYLANELIGKANTNKLLKRKRLRYLSLNSIDLNNHYFDFEDNEADFQRILLNMFEFEKNLTEDLVDFEEYQEVCFMANNLDNHFAIPAFEPSQNVEELFNEFLV